MYTMQNCNDEGKISMRNILLSKKADEKLHASNNLYLVYVCMLKTYFKRLNILNQSEMLVY